MKTAMIARFVLGASAIFAAAGLVGCGAEQGTGDPGAIGSTSEALTNTNVVASTALVTSMTNRFTKFGSSCLITDTSTGAGNKPYMLVAGGIKSFSPSTTYSSDAYLWDGSSWFGPFDFSGSGAARAFGVLVTDPAHSNACEYLGGENGAKLDTIVTLTISSTGGGAPTITPTTGGKLSSARSKLQAVPCGNKILAIGGDDGTSTVLDVWDSSFNGGSTAIPVLKNTNASPATVTLTEGRFDLAVAQSAHDANRIVVAGGENAGSGQLASIEAIITDTTGGNCKLASNAVASPTIAHPLAITTLTAGANVVRLGGSAAAVVRSQLVGAYKSFSGNTENYVFALGDKLGTASSQEDVFTIDWSTPASSANVSNTATPTNAKAAARPLFVSFATNRFIVVGGTGTGKNYVQEYNAGTWTSTSTDSVPNALPNREGPTGILLNGHVYAVGGDSGSSTLINSMEQVY